MTSAASLAPAVEVIDLPNPGLPLEASLEQVLKQRRSTRSFVSDRICMSGLSTLLWAAFGVNRPEEDGRTAPSARGWKETIVHAVLPEGAYRYDPIGHRLLLVAAGDFRAQTGLQDFVAEAPLNLVYVADLSHMADVLPAEDRPFLAGADAGFIAQNVYLCCAALGLATVVRAMIDRRALALALRLTPNQRITLAQTVGYA